MGIYVAIAKPSSYIELAQLGANTFYETWRPVNTEEDMYFYIKKSFNQDLIRSEIENNTVNTFLLAGIKDELIGYAKLRRDRTYDEFKNDKVIEIERIYVYKDWQDKKVGKLLMDKCISIAEEEKYDWIWLGVNIDNHKAIEFYKRYNFTIFGEKAFQLGDAVDNDYLMKRKI